MLRIDVLCVGGLKEPYWKEAVKEYTKRLTPYCTLSVKEVPEERLPQNASEKDLKVALEKEAERLEKLFEERAKIIVLAIDGKKYSSEAFALKIADAETKGCSHLQFVIGGSVGLHERIAASADERISFSDMTFPHHMMRVILLEQIYRAFKIRNGEPYHK